MKKEYLKYSYITLLIISTFMLFTACGSGGGGDGGAADTTDTTQDPDTTTSTSTVSTITLSATPANLAADGSSTSTIEATVSNSLGNAVPDGEVINFTVTSGTGTLSSASTATSAGKATITYTASASAGTETITSKATNSVTQSINITLGNLAGTVLNSDGSPAVGATVSVPGATVGVSKLSFISAQGEAIESVTTDDKGGFVFVNVSQAVHAILVSKPGSVDAYRIVDLTQGASKKKTFLLNDSKVSAVNVLSTSGFTFTSNSINGDIATLDIPAQAAGFVVGDLTDQTTANISLEYLDITEPLPVPLPSPRTPKRPETLASADVKIGDKQAPKVVVAIYPALLTLGTAATLTLPNPDNLPSQTRILRFDAATHLWVDTGEKEDGTTLPITKGGV